MKQLLIWFALLVPLGLATPALAASCQDVGGGPTISFEFHFGDDYTEDDRNEFLQMELQRRGIDASRAEMWGGCIRAFVPNANGRGEHMEYFNPNTFEQVD